MDLRGQRLVLEVPNRDNPAARPFSYQCAWAAMRAMIALQNDGPPEWALAEAKFEDDA